MYTIHTKAISNHLPTKIDSMWYRSRFFPHLLRHKNPFYFTLIFALQCFFSSTILSFILFCSNEQYTNKTSRILSISSIQSITHTTYGVHVWQNSVISKSNFFPFYIITLTACIFLYVLNKLSYNVLEWLWLFSFSNFVEN